ncbi:hypothetical protein BKA70DRAFT_1346720, partial [Coprinopsis sp. MPI-PUGE-AT-0042]
MNARLEGHSIFASWVQTLDGTRAAGIPGTYPLGKRSRERRSRSKWNCSGILRGSCRYRELHTYEDYDYDHLTYPSPASRLLLSIPYTLPPPEPSAPSNPSSAPSPSPTSPLSNWHRTTSPICFLDVHRGTAEDLELAVVIDGFWLTAPLHAPSTTPLLR